MRALTVIISHVQGCTLAEPGGPWCPTFARVRVKSQIFHTNHRPGTLDFTGSELWAPLNSPKSTALMCFV